MDQQENYFEKSPSVASRHDSTPLAVVRNEHIADAAPSDYMTSKSQNMIQGGVDEVGVGLSIMTAPVPRSQKFAMAQAEQQHIFNHHASQVDSEIVLQHEQPSLINDINCSDNTIIIVPAVVTRSSEKQMAHHKANEIINNDYYATEDEKSESNATALPIREQQARSVSLLPKTPTSNSNADAQSQATALHEKSQSKQRRNVQSFSYEPIQHAKQQQKININPLDTKDQDEEDNLTYNQRTSQHTEINQERAVYDEEFERSMQGSAHHSYSMKETEQAPSNQGAVGMEHNGNVQIITISDGEDAEAFEGVLDYNASINQENYNYPVPVQSNIIIRSQEGIPSSFIKESESILIEQGYDTQKDSVLEETEGGNTISKQKEQAASDQTNQIKRQSEDYSIEPASQKIKKDSIHALSSDNSHQNTRSAVEKGNLEQRCTDPSNRDNQDSHASSAVSNYFHQIEPECIDGEDSISKQIIMENDEFYHNDVNADLQHLNDGVEQATLISVTEIQKNNVSQEIVREKDSAMTLVERSKESTDLGIPSQNLEYSRSMNQIEAVETSLGIKADLEQEQRKSQGSQHLHVYEPSLGAMEKTPQFHGSSPVILQEQNVEESNNNLEMMPVQPQQPNYESDTGGVVSEINSTNQISKDYEQNTNLIQTSGEVIIHGTSNTQPQSPQQFQLMTLPSADKFEYQTTVKILPGSEGYDPNCLITESKDSTINEIQPRNTIYSQKSNREAPTVPVLKIQSQVNYNVADNQSQEQISPRVGAFSQNRYENEVRVSGSTTGDQKRGSQQSVKRCEVNRASRFSKGHQDELDKVADHINRSFVLNSQSNCGDSLPTFKNGQADPNQNDYEPKGGRDSCELPVSLDPLKRSGIAQLKADIQPITIQGESENERDFQEPDFPNEENQRFSTPRQQDYSPVSKLSTISPDQQTQELQPVAYPIVISKNKVIRAPVLKSQYDKMQIENGKLKSTGAFKKRKRMTQDRPREEVDLEVSAVLAPVHKKEKPKQDSGSKERQLRVDRRVSQGSNACERAEHPSICLPKKRIKQGGKSQQGSKLAGHLSDASKSRERKPRPPRQTNARINLLNAKKDARLGSRQAKTRMADSIKTYTSVFQQNQDRSLETVQHATSTNESQDISINSLFRIGNRGNNNDISQFDRKVTPGYPQPVTIDDSSTIDFNESVSRPFAGISQQQISDLPVDQLYQMMNRNWTKEQAVFEQKCAKLLKKERQDATGQSQNPNDEAKTRLERFELLRKRLLANGSGKMQRNDKLKGNAHVENQAQRALTQDQVMLNENLREIEQSVFHHSQDITKKPPKPLQYGQYQFIFNKPEEFIIAPSPTAANAGRRQQTSAHQSQGQFRRPIGLASNAGIRQNSMVLTPKIANSFGDFNQRNVSNALAINATPESQILDHSYYHQSKPKTLTDRQAKSMNNTGQNFAINRNSKEYGGGDAPKILWQNERAATANNHKQRPNAFAALSGSPGFLSSASMNKASGLQMPRISSDHEQTVLSPTANEDQKRLLQKLQYRSMRGRRIKEYLQHVKQNPKAAPSQRKKVSEPFNMYPADPQTDGNLSDSTIMKGTQVQSQSSFQYGGEDYGATSNPAILQNKLKSSQAFASDDGSSLNVLESRNDLPRILGGKRGGKVQDSMGSSISKNDQSLNNIPRSVVSQSSVLNDFIAMQDKRIDFGLCSLYRKVRDGAGLELETIDGCKIMKLAELESLLTFIKRKNMQTLTRPFQLRAHQDCFTTIQQLLTELGMGYRVARMQREEDEVTIERVYVLACRAHKLHRARIELVNIFDQIVQLEDTLPKLKQQIMSKLAGSALKGSAGSEDLWGSYADSEGVAGNIDTQAKAELEVRSQELKNLLSQLVVNIPSLLRKFKFFNDSFVFSDKDYLKYLGKEANEIKGLLSVYGIRF